VCTPQLARLSARAVADVPSAIAAITLTNAHANSKELVILLTNFVFISVDSLLSLDFIFLFRPSLISHRGKSFLAVHRCTPQNLAVRYAERCKNHKLLRR
jgi:hypothetical protein